MPERPGMPGAIRVTTYPTYYEENPENIEPWSPRNPFPEGAGAAGNHRRSRLA